MSETVIVSNQPTVVQIIPPGTGSPITASAVGIVDAGGYYTSANVEGALQEVGATNSTQTADIATNTGNIATNTGNIATNTADIATNTSAIATKFDTAGRALNSSGTTVNVDDDFTSTQYDSAYQTLSFGATVAWDMSSGQAAKLTVTGDCLISNPTNKNSITPILEVVQDGTGGHTVTFDTDFAEVDVSQVTTGSGSITYYAFIKGSDGSFRGQGKTFSA